MKGENRMTKDELIKKMYDIRKEGFELTRKSLSKIDANIYTNAEDIFGSWVAAKKEFYEYERQLKKKERAERAAKNKNKSNRKPKVETVTTEPQGDTSSQNDEVVVQDTILAPANEATSTQTELSVNDTINNNVSDTDVYSELEKSIFKNIDNVLTERDKECISTGIMPHNVVELFSGFKEDFISKYIKYFMTNNSLSKDSILKIIKENITAQDISLNASAKDKFEHINNNILEKFNSIEHAIIELIKK